MKKFVVVIAHDGITEGCIEVPGLVRKDTAKLFLVAGKNAKQAKAAAYKQWLDRVWPKDGPDF